MTATGWLPNEPYPTETPETCEGVRLSVLGEVVASDDAPDPDQSEPFPMVCRECAPERAEDPSTWN